MFWIVIFAILILIHAALLVLNLTVIKPKSIKGIIINVIGLLISVVFLILHIFGF